MNRDLEDIVRRAFEARAGRVEMAADALGSIRARCARGPRRARTMPVTWLATAAAVAVAVVVLGMNGFLASEPAPPPAGTAPPPAGTALPTKAPPSMTPPATPGPTTAPPPGVNVRVPVYFTADVADRIVLYREFHSGTAPAVSLAGRIEVAVSAMLGGRALDPDYVSAWPSGATVREVRIDGDVAVVDLAGAGTNDAGSEPAAAAVQQLVYTVTAVAADRGIGLRGVRLRLDGREVDELWGHVPAGDVLTRASALMSLAPVWLISPQEGDTVGRGFDVQLSGAVPEAAVQLWVRDAAGAVVQRHTIMLSAGGPDRGDADVSITLAPGRYTLEAFFHSLADGSVQALDDHAITVR